jgi:hypothetical protein
MKSMTQIQDEYIDKVKAGIQRWSHRKNGGHTSRILRGARKRAEKQLFPLGFSEAQVRLIISEARQMAELEMSAE